MNRLSPLSVPYRAARRGASIAFTLAFVLLTGAPTADDPVGRLLALALVGLGLVGLVGYEVARWYRYEYELTEDTFDIRSGVVARRTREIPLWRVQNVDLSRNVVQRLLGIAAVDIETAGGGRTEAAIRYVSAAEAKRLQVAVTRARERAGDASADVDTGRDGERHTGEASESAPAGGGGEDGEELFALTPRELALVGVFSFDLRTPGIVLFLGYAGISVAPELLPESVDSVATAALALAGVAVATVLVSWVAGGTAAVLNYYGFRLTRVGDELRYERGLLRRYDGTIPLGKVQALTIEDNPLKRRFGYATLYIETAGYAPSGRGADGSQAAVPLARTERVGALAQAIEPFGGPELARPPKRVRRRYLARFGLGLAALVALLYGIDAVGVSVPWAAPLVLGPALPVAAHLRWRHRGHWLGPAHFVTRNGVVSRETKIVPHDRIQTILDSRSLLQRRWSLGSVTADTAGTLSLSGSEAAAVDVAASRADELRERLARDLVAALDDGSGNGGESGADEVEPSVDLDGDRAAPGDEERPAGGTDA